MISPKKNIFFKNSDLFHFLSDFGRIFTTILKTCFSNFFSPKKAIFRKNEKIFRNFGENIFFRPPAGGDRGAT